MAAMRLLGIGDDRRVGQPQLLHAALRPTLRAVLVRMARPEQLAVLVLEPRRALPVARARHERVQRDRLVWRDETAPLGRVRDAVDVVEQPQTVAQRPALRMASLPRLERGWVQVLA